MCEILHENFFKNIQAKYISKMAVCLSPTVHRKLDRPILQIKQNKKFHILFHTYATNGTAQPKNGMKNPTTTGKLFRRSFLVYNNIQKHFHSVRVQASHCFPKESHRNNSEQGGGGGSSKSTHTSTHLSDYIINVVLPQKASLERVSNTTRNFCYSLGYLI